MNRALKTPLHQGTNEFKYHLLDNQFRVKCLWPFFKVCVYGQKLIHLSRDIFQVSILMGTTDPYRFARTALIFLFPQIAKLFNVPVINGEATDFLVSIIRCVNRLMLTKHHA